MYLNKSGNTPFRRRPCRRPSTERRRRDVEASQANVFVPARACDLWRGYVPLNAGPRAKTHRASYLVRRKRLEPAQRKRRRNPVDSYAARLRTADRHIRVAVAETAVIDGFDCREDGGHHEGVRLRLRLSVEQGGHAALERVSA